MDRVEAARVFIEIIERGSMIAAADHLDMSRSKVTRYLNEIESWANARLLHRSTRRLSLTDAGEQVLQQCRELVTIADDIPLSSQSQVEAIKGHLRISCAHYAAEHLLLPILPLYRRRYPQVSIELQISNATVDLIEQRIDLAIRISSELDPNLIARRVGGCPSVLCASPTYLQQRGMPQKLEDLVQHECLIYSYFGKHALWRFDQDGEILEQAVSGQLIANDSNILAKAVRQHMGIGYQPRADVQAYLDNGELQEILPQFTPVEMGVFAVYRSREKMPQALRLLLDMLAESTVH